jgi:hypothetical protein
MTVIAYQDALNKLRQEARRRRQAALLREASRLRQHATMPRPHYEAPKPQIKMVVSEWYTDELGNQARIIKTHD